MARKLLSGFELGSFVQEFECNVSGWSPQLDVGVVGTAPTVQTTTKRSGAYALRSSAGSGTASVLWIDEFSDLMTGYWRFYINIATAPSAEDIIAYNERTDLRDIWQLRLTSGRQLKLYNGTPGVGLEVLIGTSAALTLGTWYCIEGKFVISASAGVIEGKVDGTAFATGTGLNTGTGGIRTYNLGLRTNHTNTPVIFFDDLAIDDSAYPGEGKILVAKPNSNGYYNNAWENKIGTFTNDWDGVMQVPISEAQGWYTSSSGYGQVIKNFGLQSCSDLGLSTSDTIKSVSCGVWTKHDTGTAGTPGLVVRENSTDTITNLTSLLLTSSTWHQKIYSSCPSTGTTWTQADFDSLEIGMRSSGDGEDVYMYEVLAMVEYASPVTASATSTAKTNIVYTGKVALVSPTNQSNQSNDVYLIWTLPSNSFNYNIHSHVEIDNINTFESKERDLYSNVDSGFEYWNGSQWVAYPVGGVPSDYYGNQARVVVSLTGAETKYWRVTCGG